MNHSQETRDHEAMLDEDRTPAELLAAYRAELARLYGEEYARLGYIGYEAGWFVVSLAHRTAPEVWAAGRQETALRYRRHEILSALQELRGREVHG